jgi:aminopeptidase N
MSKLPLCFLFMLLLPCAALPSERTVPAVPEYDLSVSFDIPASRITGLATIYVPGDQEIVFAKGALIILQVTLNDRRIDSEARNGILRIKPSESGTLAIRYEGVFRESGTSMGGNDGGLKSVIDARGISLTGMWYPQPKALYRYRLAVTLPRGYDALSEAERIENREKGDNREFLFHFDRPIDTIDLIASNRFEVIKDQVNDIELYAYFFPEDKGLARTYLQNTKKYMERYETLLVKYPYKRFAIIENFLPLGYSKPTFALLGQDVLRLPLAPETSFGHEVLRQWFGNFVYIDLDKGNWAEGLITCLADCFHEEQNSREWECRKQRLVDYNAYVNSENEISLREFTRAEDRSSEAVGYGKGSMVFHMLKNTVGEEQFYSALKRFISQNQYQHASWNDIKAAFVEQSGKDLTSFFIQWVDVKGLPDLSLANTSVKRAGDSFEINFDILQKGKNYTLELPVVISSMQGNTKKEKLSLDAEKKNFKLSTDFEPRTMVIDRDYDVARKLTEPETPPVIAALLGDKKPLVVLPVANGEAYKTIITSLQERGAQGKEAAALKDSEIKASTLIILGDDNPVASGLFGKTESVKAGFSIAVRKNPWNEKKMVGIINVRSSEEAMAILPKIALVSNYSVLAYDEGRNVLKKIEESQRGMEMELREPATAIDLSTLRTLYDVIENAAEKKIVYVGEYHDRFSHHVVELEVIKGLYRKDPKIAVGMEMFQRPFQKTLDDYIKGTIDEREFLKNTEYFKRWGFDYNLYKPILDFARGEKVPVVALNLRREITEKVSKEGIDSLSEDEKKEIPPQLNFSDDEYRDRLKEVFEQHKSLGEKNFDFFYQSQVLWDETMAMSIDEYLRKNPDQRMVVIAGSGHVSYGSGIPKRAFRRNGFPYEIILNDGELEKDIAHYLVFPQPLDGVTSPKLMAVFKEEKGKIIFTDFAEDSPAKNAGIKKGDVLVTIDGAAVHDVSDIRLALFYRRQGDILKVHVIRKRFLLGEKDMEFEVHL